MISLDYVDVHNMENAIRGMRNPLESYSKSDSVFEYSDGRKELQIGSNDLSLALQLIKAGNSHSKFLRQILVSMDITAPLYWWSQMDQYKVATVTNSTSKMHTIHKNKITPDLFSLDTINPFDIAMCEHLEYLREMYIDTKDKEYWRRLIQRLPSSFNQTRTWTGNYQVLREVIQTRKNHKLEEWVVFCDLLSNCLPYPELITN